MKEVPWPFEDFSRSIAGPGNRRFAMFVAYFDESGTHGDSRFVSVAGLVGSSQEWALLDLPWRKRIEPFGSFHATDCAAGVKAFSSFPDGDNKNRLSTDLAEMIAARKLVGIAYSMPRDEWNYGLSDDVKAHYPDIYHFCLSAVVAMVNRISRDNWDSEPVAFVFAKHQQFEKFAAQIHATLSQDSVNYPAVGSLTFADPEYVIPLQAADLYAYETYRQLQRKLDGDDMSLPSPRRQMRALSQILQQSHYGTIDGVHFMSDEYEKIMASRASSSAEPTP